MTSLRLPGPPAPLHFLVTGGAGFIGSDCSAELTCRVWY